MNMDRYVVIVVDRSTGEPYRLGDIHKGDEGAEKAHDLAARHTNEHTYAWVVGLR